MSETRVCPYCKFPLREDPDSCFSPPEECPYKDTPYPELCSLHDKIYFGKWRRMDASELDIRRAAGRIRRLLSGVRREVEREDNPSGRRHLGKAEELLSRAEALDNPYERVRYLDSSLSYIHHALNDLLHERGAKPHDPSDYERFYDIILPFREEW